MSRCQPCRLALPWSDGVFVVIALGAARCAAAEMVVYEVVAELAAAVANAVGKYVGDRVEQDKGRAQRGTADKNHFCFVFNGLVGLGIDDQHAFGAFFIFVVQDLVDDGKWAQGQVAGCLGGRQSGRLGAEIRAEGAASAALAAHLALPAVVVRLGQVGHAADDHGAFAAVMLFDARGHVFFHDVHVHGR
jgi:hypothetical protein